MTSDNISNNVKVEDWKGKPKWWVRAKKDNIQNLLDNPFLNHNELMVIFTWRNTPQGETYWNKRYSGVEELSEDDLSYLRALLKFPESVGK